MAELDKTISVIESWLKQPVLTPPPINELYDALELLKKQVPLEPIHIHEEYPEHEWETNEKGEIDEFAMDYGYHNGPSCKRCYYSFCMHCEPNGWNDKPCVIDYYKCPKCHKQICKNKAFCEYCGQAVKWE